MPRLNNQNPFFVGSLLHYTVFHVRNLPLKDTHFVEPAMYLNLFISISTSIS